MNWISVKNQLPEHDQVVLAVFEIPSSEKYDWYKYPSNLCLLNFFKESPYKQFFRDKSTLRPINSEKITHWMPLPNPPTVK